MSIPVLLVFLLGVAIRTCGATLVTATSTVNDSDASSFRHRRLFNVDYTPSGIGVGVTQSGTLSVFNAGSSSSTSEIVQYASLPAGDYRCRISGCGFSMTTPTVQLSIKFGSIHTSSTDPAATAITDSTQSCGGSGSILTVDATSSTTQDLYFMIIITGTGTLNGAGFACFELPNIDGQLALDAASSTFALSSYASETAAQTTQLYQISQTINAGESVTCTLTQCTLPAGVALLAGKFGSLPDPANSDYDVVNNAMGESSCPTSFSVTASATADLYVWALTAPASMSAASMTCTGPPVATTTTNPAPTSAPGSGSSTHAPTACPTCACFSGDSTVEVEGQGPTAMRDLRVSDSVFVGGEDTTDQYQPVYAFGHHDASTPTVYVRIHTNASSPHNILDPLEISPAHLVYIKGQSQPVRADTVEPGHSVIFQLENSSAAVVTVTRVDTITRPGAFMPLTAKGTIIVNSIQASTYVSIIENAPQVVNKVLMVMSEDQLLHGWLSPYRVLCLQLTPWLCRTQGHKEEEEEEGIAHWLLFGKSLAEFGNTLGWFGQALGLVAVGVFIGLSMVLETILGMVMVLTMNPALALVAGVLLQVLVARKVNSSI